jgi:hypothetical protein
MNMFRQWKGDHQESSTTITIITVTQKFQQGSAFITVTHITVHKSKYRTKYWCITLTADFMLNSQIIAVFQFLYILCIIHKNAA